jgi:hypothetical protein
MKELRKISFLAMLSAVFIQCSLVAPAFAHHSFAMYDRSKVLTVSGTVRTWQFANPHSTLTLEATENGAPVEYTIEGSSVNTLIRIGWGAKTFAPGDKVTVVMNPQRENPQLGAFLRATLANGKTLSAGSQVN